VENVMVVDAVGGLIVYGVKALNKSGSGLQPCEHHRAKAHVDEVEEEREEDQVEDARAVDSRVIYLYE
jgi:hypothetical protein